MPRFRRGASSTPRPRDSSADGPGILDGPVKRTTRSGEGLPRLVHAFAEAGDHAQHAGRPAVPIAARPPRNSGAAGPRVALDDADLYRHRLGAVFRSGLADADQRDTAPRGQAIGAVRREKLNAQGLVHRQPCRISAKIRLGRLNACRARRPSTAPGSSERIWWLHRVPKAHPLVNRCLSE